MRNIIFMIGVAVVLMFSVQLNSYSCACTGKGSVVDKTFVSSPSGETNVGNKVCPVMGGKIVDGQSVKVTHKGKVYNLCCAGCVGTFKNNPQKYINIINSEGNGGYLIDSCSAVQSCEG